MFWNVSHLYYGTLYRYFLKVFTVGLGANDIRDYCFGGVAHWVCFD